MGAVGCINAPMQITGIWTSKYYSCHVKSTSGELYKDELSGTLHELPNDVSPEEDSHTSNALTIRFCLPIPHPMHKANKHWPEGAPTKCPLYTM
jgi:hypothetical protein